MRLDLSRLTKSQINEIVKSLPPKFSGIVPYGISHFNSKVQNKEEIKGAVFELYNRGTEEIFDKWGEYNLAKNSIFVMAWDNRCKWQVGVLLFEDHFEIPEYKNGMYAKEFEKSFPEYKEKVARMVRMSSNYSYSKI